MRDRTADRIKLALSLLYCGIAALFAVAAFANGKPAYLLGSGVWTCIAYAVGPSSGDE
jgi:hypothetical protein